MKSIIHLFLLIACVVCLASCHDDVAPDDKPESDYTHGSTLLVYAVASNNLRSSLDRDIDEIKEALRNTPSASVLVYEARDQYIYGEYVRSNPQLKRYYSEGTEAKEEILKEYPASVASTDPQRMSEVIDDAASIAGASLKGLILWSHALGWQPANNKASGKKRSFGLDIRDKMDIDLLADAIPDAGFEYIWMDCCYMSSIEVIYQLRKKARYYIGYPTEILSAGLPYDRVIPLLLRDNPDIRKAAEKAFGFYNSFDDYRRSMTIAVSDLSRIEEAADAAAEIMRSFSPVDTEGMQRYSRFDQGPYFDLGEYLSKMASFADDKDKLIKRLNSALSGMVVFKAATPSFLPEQHGFMIREESFSGISAHAFAENGSHDEEFYKTLDWYKRVFPATD